VGNLLAVIRFACRERQWRIAVGIGLRVHSYLFWARRTKDAEARLRMAISISRQPGGPQRALPMLDVCVEVFDDVADRRALARPWPCGRRPPGGEPPPTTLAPARS
jgi:hypothetical protein